MQDEKCYKANTHEDIESSSLTSDNAYPGALFSASQIAYMLGITPTRVRQIAQNRGVGKRVGGGQKFLLFTFDDLMLFVEVRKSKMRNKIKRMEEKHELAVREEEEEPYRRIVKAMVERMMNQVMLMIHECSIGMFNRLTKVQDDNNRKFQLIEEEITEIRKTKT